MGNDQYEKFFLFYRGTFGRAAKFCDAVNNEIMLPLSQIRFRPPAPNKALDPVVVFVPYWLAQQKGLI